MAQGTAGTSAEAEPRVLVTMPTAGLLIRNQYAAEVQAFPGDGIRARLQVGLWNRLLLGLSYSGSAVVGADPPRWQGPPGATARIRLLDESLRLPAVVLGFDSQGTGAWAADRFAVRSPGAFVAASKNFALLGFLGVHGGAGYSLEPDAKHVNGWLGIEQTLGPLASVLAEYNLAADDRTGRSGALDAGDLNLAARLSLGALTAELSLLDITGNRPGRPSSSRLIRIEYVAGF